MGEHTPGPWSIGYGDADFLVIEAGIDEEIACIEMEDHGACPTAEQSANALLIAAAPDLLAAVLAILPFIAEIDDPCTGEIVNAKYLSTEYREALEKLIAAVAKAKDAK